MYTYAKGTSVNLQNALFTDMILHTVLFLNKKKLISYPKLLNSGLMFIESNFLMFLTILKHLIWEKDRVSFWGQL